ncbi:hypothetical protein GCM10028895_05050 [Pontibacter rugosus]
MFACICIIYLLLQKNIRLAYKIVLCVIGLELLIGTFIFSARMSILAFTIALGFSIIVYFKSLKKSLLFLCFLLASIYALIHVPTVSYRIDELLDTKLQPPSGKPWDPDGGEQYNSTNIRVGIVICSFELIKKHWLFGLGQSEVQPALNQCYSRFSMEGPDDYKSAEYNTHNQYIHFWLSSGLLGIVLFIGYIMYIFYRSFIKNDILLFTFMVFISICIATENILARHSGVVFVALFSSFLMFRNSKLLTTDAK